MTYKLWTYKYEFSQNFSEKFWFLVYVVELRCFSAKISTKNAADSSWVIWVFLSQRKIYSIHIVFGTIVWAVCYPEHSLSILQLTLCMFSHLSLSHTHTRRFRWIIPLPHIERTDKEVYFSIPWEQDKK